MVQFSLGTASLKELKRVHADLVAAVKACDSSNRPRLLSSRGVSHIVDDDKQFGFRRKAVVDRYHDKVLRQQRLQ